MCLDMHFYGLPLQTGREAGRQAGREEVVVVVVLLCALKWKRKDSYSTHASGYLYELKGTLFKLHSDLGVHPCEEFKGLKHVKHEHLSTSCSTHSMEVAEVVLQQQQRKAAEMCRSWFSLKVNPHNRCLLDAAARQLTAWAVIVCAANCYLRT